MYTFLLLVDRSNRFGSHRLSQVDSSPFKSSQVANRVCGTIFKFVLRIFAVYFLDIKTSVYIVFPLAVLLSETLVCPPCCCRRRCCRCRCCRRCSICKSVALSWTRDNLFFYFSSLFCIFFGKGTPP